MLTNDFATARAAELIEAHAWAANFDNFSPRLREAIGADVLRFGSAVGLVASDSSLLGLNKVLGLGFDERFSMATVEKIIDTYAQHGVGRFLLQLSPFAESDVDSSTLAARGFRPIRGLAKLCCVPRQSLARDDGLEIRVIDARLAEDMVKTAGSVEPSALADAFRGSVGRPGWTHYAAYASGQPIAGAALFARDGIAWLGFSATVEDQRRRGAHTALLVRRISDAAERGCRLVVAETAEDTADRPNVAYRNMLKVGLELMYVRPNYLFDGSQA